MRRAALFFGLAGVLILAHGATQLFDLAPHTSALAGMPLSEASWVLGPLHVAAHLAFVVGAPVLLIAGLLDVLALAIVASKRCPTGCPARGR